MLRAERNAAWSSSQPFGASVAPAASMEAWGLMARAKLGDDQALQALRRMADEVPLFPGPLPAINQVKPDEYQAKRRALDDFASKVRRRGYALFALALMKEPGIQEKALAALRNKPADAEGMGMFFFGHGGDTNPLILAVLEAGAAEGFKSLVDYCSDEKNAVKDQAQVLSELNILSSPPPFRAAEDKFSIAGEIRQRLPKDAQQRLVSSYVSILKRYVPDPKHQWDHTLNYISNMAMVLPEKALPPEGVAALEDLVNRLPGPNEQYPKQSIITVLKRYGKDPGAAVRPPAPPGKTPEF